MEYVKKYIASNIYGDKEEIRILKHESLKYPKGKYYIHYGWMEKHNQGCCIAGEFETLEEAEKRLKKHRPSAKEVIEDRTESDYTWIAIVEDGNGKIQIFKKYCDNCDSFLYEVKQWNAGNIIAVYREEDIKGVTKL